jgi:hypothetical protein
VRKLGYKLSRMIPATFIPGSTTSISALKYIILELAVVLPVLLRGVEVRRINMASECTIFYSVYLLAFKILEEYKQPNIQTVFIFENLLITRV